MLAQDEVLGKSHKMDKEPRKGGAKIWLFSALPQDA